MTREQHITAIRDYTRKIFKKCPRADALVHDVIALRTRLEQHAEEATAIESDGYEGVCEALDRVSTLHVLLKEAIAPIEHAHNALLLASGGTG